MNYFNRLIGFISFLLLFQLQAVSADEYDEIRVWMETSGFENIQLNNSGKTLIIAYENRIFRHEAEAIAYILKEMPLYQIDEIILIPLYLKIPMLQMTVKKAKLEQFRKGEITTPDFLAHVIFTMNIKDDIFKDSLSSALHSSGFKVDVLIEPKISMQLGNYDRPIQLLAELAPNLQVQLAKGLILNSQFLIPVYNNLKQMEGAKFRTGIINLSQNLRLPDNLFLTASLGTFSYDRLGIDFKTKKYFLNGSLGIYTQMGYNTWIKTKDTFEDRYFNQDNYFMGRLGAEYRFTAYDLLISASYGTFLYQDKGWRFDVLRQFNEVQIGFSGILTNDTYNAGFYLSIPIFPKRYAKLNKFRVRPSPNFNWGYNFRGQTYAGKNYSTGSNIISKSRDFNPFFIKNQLKILLAH